ncbi:MAG TPA: hypothetical protein VLM40_20035, partial [Gemmata sp.]|nr:hypothetical protein [Gemmata sp.]
RVLSLCVALLFPIAARADDDKGKWVPISANVLAKVKPGYPGKTAGVAVDPATGDVFMVVPDQGIWKSTDHGESFTRVDGKAIGGRCETGFALNFDPAGKRLACFMIYGSCATTEDGGKTWTAWKTNHLDFGAVDWSTTGKCYLAIRHEKNGTLTFSMDAGKSWTDLGTKFNRVGLFDDKIMVCGKAKGLVRSEDAGKTWTDVSDVTPPGYVMTVRDGIGYWPTEKGLLVSKDRGKTWAIQGAAISAVHGPYFGKSADHMVVVGKDGFFETKDGGNEWKKVAPLPEGFKAGGVGPNYAWDAASDIFYASSMGKDTFRWKR